MKPVVIYTTNYCPYCVGAKMLLTQKGASFEEIDVTNNADLRDEMTEKAQGRKTVPQIFIGEIHVGGCDDLYALENKGKLDDLLA